MRRTLLVLGMGGFLVLPLVHAGESAAHGWMAPQEEAVMENPLAGDTAAVAGGARVYGEFCGQCHGERGQGLDKDATGLHRDTPSLIEGLKAHGPGDFHWKVRTGKGEMPRFADELSAEEIWSVVSYLQSLAE